MHAQIQGILKEQALETWGLSKATLSLLSVYKVWETLE